MKTLVFKSGGTIEFAECYGNPEYVQGAQRETLDFRFDAGAVTLDEVDALFASGECAKLTIRETTTVQVQSVDEEGNPVYTETPALDDEGNEVVDEEGNAVVNREPVMVDEERTAEYVYENYGVRAALSKQHYTLATAGGVEDVEQISVKMAQYTPLELRLTALEDAVANGLALYEEDPGDG